MFQRILIPLDGSQRAERAIPVAARIAHATKATLFLVQVIDLASDLAWQVNAAPFDLGDAFDAEYQGAKDYLHKLQNSDELKGLSVHTLTPTGRASQVILSLAQSKKVDLIVMTSHGYTGFKRMVMGSIAQQIERHSEVPVLILRDQTILAKEEPIRNNQSAHIIVALDGTLCAEAILPAAVEVSKALSAPYIGSLHLAMVLPEKRHEIDKTETEASNAIQTAQSYLALISQNVQKANPVLEISTSISVEVNIAEALTRLAEMGGLREEDGTFTSYDLIAMATHGREGLERLLHTSITEQVLDTAKVPLLIIRSQQAQQAEASTTTEQETKIYTGPIGLL